MCNPDCKALEGGDEPRLSGLSWGRRVTELEAGRLEETREQREQFLLQLRQEIERQAAAKRVVVHFPGDEAPKEME